MESERIPLAELTSAELDAATLAALFADIGSLTIVDEVLVKGSATAYAGAAGLSEAQQLLAAGAIGLQIRYRWQGEAWWDTLIRTQHGYRLVRSRAPT
ncbi:MAG: hypothetical protein AAB263_18880 [Planctomycetota bacterium]